MNRRTGERIAPLVVVAAIVAGCGAGPSTEPSATAPVASLSATVPPSPVVTPTAAPSGKLAPLPTAAPSPATAGDEITATLQLISEGECRGLSATIDATGHYHAASTCDGGIRYLTSKDGARWTETLFPTPLPDRLEMDPQLAVDGEAIVLAYSRLAIEDGGCGDDGLTDLGVYVRSRPLPDGAWSEPVRIGPEGDRIQALRATGGKLHMTVTAADGRMYYESQAGQDLTRIVIPDAITTSLRVGDDGRARIAYATGHAIEFARVDAGQLSILTIAATEETYLMRPSLVLGPGDRGYVTWTQYADAGGGCAEIGPGPLDGTYFGTDAAGRWVGRRLTEQTGAHSLTLDPATGRIHVVQAQGWRDWRLAYFTSPDGLAWSSRELADTEQLSDPVIRLDRATGRPVVFGISWGDRAGISVFAIEALLLDGLDEGDIGG